MSRSNSGTRAEAHKIEQVLALCSSGGGCEAEPNQQGQGEGEKAKTFHDAYSKMTIIPLGVALLELRTVAIDRSPIATDGHLWARAAAHASPRETACLP